MKQLLTAELVHTFALGLLQLCGETMQVVVVKSSDEQAVVRHQAMTFVNEIARVSRRFGIEIDRRIMSSPCWP